MNPRERYLETLLFGQPDRVPCAGRAARIHAGKWHTQGLPEGAN